MWGLLSRQRIGTTVRYVGKRKQTHFYCVRLGFVLIEYILGLQPWLVVLYAYSPLVFGAIDSEAVWV